MLMLGIPDVQFHRHLLSRASVVGASHRRRSQVIRRGSDPNVAIGGANSVRRIEADPAQIGDPRFGPGVSGVLINDVALTRAALESKL